MKRSYQLITFIVVTVIALLFFLLLSSTKKLIPYTDTIANDNLIIDNTELKKTSEVIVIPKNKKQQ